MWFVPEEKWKGKTGHFRFPSESQKSRRHVHASQYRQYESEKEEV